MIPVKFRILIFLIFASVFYFIKAKEFEVQEDNEFIITKEFIPEKDEENICSEKVPTCTKTKGNCLINIDDKSANCKCTDEGITYNNETGCLDVAKICKEKVSMCGTTKGNCSVNIEDNSVKCICPEGIPYVDITGCMNTTKVCEDKFPMCKKTDGTCSVIVENDVFAECNCPADIQYNTTTGCLDIKKICIEEMSKCEETGGICSVNAENNTTKCECPKGMQYKAETGCEAINEICGEDYPRCEETGGFCRRNSSGNKICQCPHHLQYDKNDGCKDLCKSKCGEDPGVKCVGDLSSEDGFNCTCKEEDAQFISRLQVCKLPCDENKTCENEGSCEKSDDISYCICMKKTSGHFCEIVDDCEHDPHLCGDQNSGAKCVFDAELEKAVCACENELKFDKRYKKCRETCENDGECENGGLCVEIGDDKFCRCLKGTSGHRCEIIDDCNTKRCSEDSFCSYDIITRKVFCRCNDTNKIYDFEKNKCNEIDDCILKTINNECNKPNEECRDGKCQCKKNYKYSDNNETCEVDICADCPVGSDCDPASDEPCKCTDGYFDGAKCIKYGKCDIGLSKCSQKCDKKTGLCKCDRGFELASDKITCNLKNNTLACDLDCDPGSCILRNGRKICICPETTHKFNDGRCIDICTLYDGKPPNNPLKCPDECEGDGSGIQCICEEIYEEADDGVHCKRKEMCKEERVIEECNKKSALCREEDNEDGYTCYCDETHEEDEEGICRKKCELAENECLKKNAHCDLDENYNVICRCPPLLSQKDTESPCNEIAKVSYTGELSFLKTKYVIDDDNRRHKRSMESVNSIHLLKDLKEAVKSVYGNSNFKDVKIIDCESSDSILKCKIELQWNWKPRDKDALISPDKCNIIEDEYCLVKNLVIKKETRYVFFRTNSCIVKDTFCDASTDCETSLGKFKCTCKKGFRKIGSFNPVSTKGNLVEKCEDIDECAEKTDNCPINSTYCINTYGSYSCDCKDGFIKIAEDKDPKRFGCKAVCNPNPCKNGGECEQGLNRKFICRCKPLFTGLTCDAKVSDENSKKDNTCLTYIGILLGLSIILTLIIIISVCIRFIKTKNENHGSARHTENSLTRGTRRCERNDNEYAEIHLQHNYRRSSPNETEILRINEISGDLVIPRAQLSRKAGINQQRQGRTPKCETSPEPSPVKNRKVQSVTQYMNKAYNSEL